MSERVCPIIDNPYGRCPNIQFNDIMMLLTSRETLQLSMFEQCIWTVKFLCDTGKWIGFSHTSQYKGSLNINGVLVLVYNIGY